MSSLESNIVRCNRMYPVGGVPAGAFGGGIIQVSSMTYSTPTTLAITANTYTNLPYSISITPRDSSNRFLIYMRFCGEISAPWNTTFCLNRNGTIIGRALANLRNAGISIPAISYAANAANDASTPESSQFWFSDNPGTTSTLTYTPVIRDAATQTIRINRTWTDSDTVNFERMISGMMILEVSG
jgi:hypothetical protein